MLNPELDNDLLDEARRAATGEAFGDDGPPIDRTAQTKLYEELIRSNITDEDERDFVEEGITSHARRRVVADRKATQSARWNGNGQLRLFGNNEETFAVADNTDVRLKDSRLNDHIAQLEISAKNLKEQQRAHDHKHATAEAFAKFPNKRFADVVHEMPELWVIEERDEW